MIKNNRLRVRNIVLSIETSVQGGSISLLENETEVDFWQGSGSVSKAEDILIELSRLLDKNTIEKNQIKQIVISRGPGSFTGTRIGLAIVLGLKKTLNCDIFGVSVLEAMAFKSECNKNIITAIPVGTKICIQKFKIGQKRELNKVTIPCLVSLESLVQRLKDDLDLVCVLYGKLYKDILVSIKAENQITKRLLPCNENLAYLIGLSRKEKYALDNLQPIYIKDAK